MKAGMSRREAMKKLMNGWRARAEKRAEEQRRRDTGLLPDGLADQIIEACKRERELILDQIEEVDQAVEDATEELSRLRRERADVMDVVQRPDRVRIDRYGNERRTTPRKVYQLGPAAMDVQRRLGRLGKHRTALKQRRALLDSRLLDVQKVERAARAGVQSAIMSIVATWVNRVPVGELLPAARLGRSFTDVAGNPLPEGAEVLDMGGRRASKSGDMLTVEASA